MGCTVQDFADEPDVILYPSIEPLSLPPNSQVEFTLTVDADTRQVSARLADALERQQPSEEVTMMTPGDEALTFSITAPGRSRWYVDLTLCGADCETRIVYTLNPENPDDPINDPYERIVFEQDVPVRSSQTCQKPDSVAVQP